jgi:hypothetical protein
VAFLAPLASTLAKQAALYAGARVVGRGVESARAQLSRAREQEITWSLGSDRMLKLAPAPTRRDPDRVLAMIIRPGHEPISVPVSVDENGNVDLHLARAAGRGAGAVLSQLQVRRAIRLAARALRRR